MIERSSLEVTGSFYLVKSVERVGQSVQPTSGGAMVLPIPSMSRLAKDISEGYITLSPAMFRGVQPDQMRNLYRELMKALQGVRGLQVDLDDFKQLKDKNTKISRLNHALQMVKYFCKERKIILG